MRYIISELCGASALLQILLLATQPVPASLEAPIPDSSDKLFIEVSGQLMTVIGNAPRNRTARTKSSKP